MAKKRVAEVEETVVDGVSIEESVETVEESFVTEEGVTDDIEQPVEEAGEYIGEELGEEPMMEETSPDEDLSEEDVSDEEIVDEEIDTDDVYIEDVVTPVEKPHGQWEHDPEEKFFSFDKEEAKRFYIDRHSFLGFVLYRTIRININVRSKDELSRFKSYYDEVTSGVQKLITDMNIRDVEFEIYQYDKNSEAELAVGDSLTAGAIMIPFSGSVNKYTNRIRNYVKGLGPDNGQRSMFYISCRTVATLRADSAKQPETANMMGFSLLSRLDSEKDNQDVKAAFRSGFWTKESNKISYDDIRQMNKYILAGGTKINRMTSASDENRFNVYRVRMNKKFFVMSYIIGKNDDGTLTVKRTLSRISIRIRKILEEFIPIGVRLKTHEDTIIVNSISEILNVDGANWLSAQIEIPEDNNFVNGLKEDFDALEKNVVSHM